MATLSSPSSSISMKMHFSSSSYIACSSQASLIPFSKIQLFGGSSSFNCLKYQVGHPQNPIFSRIGYVGNAFFTTKVAANLSSSVAVQAAMDVPAKIIDGKATAKDVRDEIAAEISRMKDAIGIVPGLAVILVGDRKDSATYVRNKKKACESVGINSYEVNLPESATEEEVLKFISDFNDDPAVHGILVQLPLPCVCLPILFY
ncbi:hypothetical protein Leryth_014864 [Lithospermum erythrorhizon]|nr:hypothetical protein Leryth_014864 [Lithospermum erythrorhizon]